MKKEEVTQQNNDMSQLGNVDQIREILFGSQARELQERFDRLENSINSINKQMHKKIEQTQTEFNSKMKNEIESINRKLKNMTTHQQDEFADIRDSAIKQEKRMQNALDIVEDELNAKNEQLQQQQSENSATLRSDMENMRDELLQVINKKIIELGTNKLSRDDAAEIMMEAAMAMQGKQIKQQLSLANVEKK